MNKKYADFRVGDVHYLRRTFSREDFENFSKLSGDTNPLHSDDAYAQQTEFRQRIVPLHLAASPLSAIAGVVFPGEKSLYLGHSLKALKPIPFDVELTYSSRIIEKNDRDQLLVLRTIIFTSDTIFVEATQQIKVRQITGEAEQVSQPSDGTFSSKKSAYLITGAAGGIGRNIAIKLAQKGHDLVLCVRKNDSRLDRLKERLAKLGAGFELLETDFKNLSPAALKKQVESLSLPVGTIIHAACPPVYSQLFDHIRVSFESLVELFSIVRYHWLCQQSGQIIFISSSATQYHPHGWESYIAAKSATENYLKGIQHHYSQYGIVSNILSPGRVDTEFSKDLDIQSSESLLPEYVADEVMSIVDKPQSFYTWLEPHIVRKGTCGFIQSTENDEKTSLHSELTKPLEAKSLDTSLKKFLTTFFNLSEILEWSSMGMDTVAGWDSLRQIELLTALEQQFGVSVASQEIAEATTFLGLLNLLKKKKNIL